MSSLVPKPFLGTSGRKAGSPGKDRLQLCNKTWMPGLRRELGRSKAQPVNPTAYGHGDTFIEQAFDPLGVRRLRKSCHPVYTDLSKSDNS